MKPVVWLAEGLGLGRIPLAPGTFGTLLGIPLYMVLSAALPWHLYLLVVLAALPLHVWICSVGARAYGVGDPSGIVWDEVVGILIALTAAPPGWAPVVAGFIVFRAFDILKPFPISWLDARISGGLGIMLDDVVAGFYALATLQVLFHWWPWTLGD
ncbi:phosphatidylglycerophosphatase A [Thiohalorhabdus methylotrophus]|uniref:Phosphatidylglycerophosphatase A n=1 Tax=Thiohalorhabdus methylotrophus TaxID=3242694 RepID=A0ABV4TY76_9GAMM